MGETRVDLLHLLEDLRDAYPGSLEETILTEIVANALDSGATNIELRADPAASTLTVMDNGRGMTRGELRRFHDLAATTKRRGRGIGFAGVGIKLALLACDEAVTETRRGATHVATSWHLASRYRAPWKWTPPYGLAPERGTAVRLQLAQPLSELLDAGYLEAMLRRHFAPLFDSSFDAILSEFYPRTVRFVVNQRQLERKTEERSSDRIPIAVKVGRKRKPAALGWLTRSLTPLPDLEQGIAISTLGKVIRRGWDWLGVTPAAPAHVSGLIEVPALAESLTLNKADFIRSGPRGATYLAYRKAVQESVTAHFTEWGDIRDANAARRSKTRPIERDVENVLLDLADEFPLIAALVERRPGGQKRLPLGEPAPQGVPDWSPRQAITTGIDRDLTPPEPSPREHDGPADGDTGDSAMPKASSVPEPQAALGATPRDALRPGEGHGRRPARFGLDIRFVERPDDPQLGRLIESTVWVNEAHPAWRRAIRARAEGYHIALTVAMAVAPLATEPAGAHAFITSFLERWGREERNGSRRRGRR